MPSDSADYSPLAMSPVKTIRKDDDSSVNKQASQMSIVGALSVQEKEKQKSQLAISLDSNPLNADITIVSEKP